MKKYIILIIITASSAVHSNAQWQQTNLPNYSVQEMTMKDNLLFAATWDNGLFVTSDNGNTWSGISSQHVDAFAVCGSKLFTGGVGLYESSDNGQQWTLNTNGLSSNVNIHAFAVNGSTILAGSLNCIYRSLDSGSTWSEITNGLPYNDWVGSFVIKDSLFFAGTYDNGIYISEDNGSSWSPVNNGLPTYIDVLALAHVDGRIFAATYNQSTYMTTDDGNNWVLVNQGDSTGWDFASFAVQGSNLFMSSMNGSGILLTADYGDTWTSVNSGLTIDSIPVMSLFIYNDTLFAGLLDAGVWKRPLSEMGFGCSTQFTLFPDTAIEHHYYITNIADGMMPLSYYWSWGDGTFDTSSYPSHTYDTAGFYTICLTINDAMGCSSTYCDSSFLQKSSNTMIIVDVIESVTGVPVKDHEQDVLFYPNPVKDFLNFNVPEKSSIDLMNINGQIIKSISWGKNTTTLDMTDLSSGVYIVRIKSDKEIITKIIIKE